eukprot:4045999-Prymnesium_polylepis.1
MGRAPSRGRGSLRRLAGGAGGGELGRSIRGGADGELAARAPRAWRGACAREHAAPRGAGPAGGIQHATAQVAAAPLVWRRASAEP